MVACFVNCIFKLVDLVEQSFSFVIDLVSKQFDFVEWSNCSWGSFHTQISCVSWNSTEISYPNELLQVTRIAGECLNNIGLASIKDHFPYHIPQSEYIPINVWHSFHPELVVGIQRPTQSKTILGSAGFKLEAAIKLAIANSKWFYKLKVSLILRIAKPIKS